MTRQYAIETGEPRGSSGTFGERRNQRPARDAGATKCGAAESREDAFAEVFFVELVGASFEEVGEGDDTDEAVGCGLDDGEAS